MIFGILAVIGLIAFAPKITDRLSAIGIADDYILYDDFEKGYLDENLWDVSASTYNSETHISNNQPAINNVKCRYFEGWSGTYYYDICGGISMLSDDGKLNIYHKDVNGIWDRGSSSSIKLLSDKELRGNSIKILGKIKEYTGTYYTDDKVYSTSSVINLYFGDEKFFTYSRKSSSQYRPNTVDFLIEMIPSFEDNNLYTIKLNGVDKEVVDVSQATSDRLTMEFDGAEDGPINPAYISFDYVKYKIPYNCKIEDDEVLVFDSFSEGSTVNISTLAYEPVKFCLDYPIKARSFSENGIKTDIRGEILQKIVRGQSSTVPPAEEWKVYYITKNVPNIELRCGVDEAYNTNTGLCESPNEKAIVGCNAQSDCYIPPGCTGVSCSCVDNKCEYVGSCIYQPQKESGTTSLWDKIMDLGFMQWIAGLFN